MRFFDDGRNRFAVPECVFGFFPPHVLAAIELWKGRVPREGTSTGGAAAAGPRQHEGPGTAPCRVACRRDAAAAASIVVMASTGVERVVMVAKTSAQTYLVEP